MKKTPILTALLLVMLYSAAPAAGPLDFTLHKLESPVKGKTLLIVGGIQGDEPGGFNAASLIVSNYNIKNGAVWVVPNLNFISIIKSCRGYYGDLNRKFSFLKDNDPEFPVIKKIKSIILDKQVDVVLNLHDGSGFYNPEHLDAMNNPRRWGQSVIIDQAYLSPGQFGDLEKIASLAVQEVNQRLYSRQHLYRVKNTNTRQGDVEMEKTLTFFAINHQKPAFGVEASKNFPTHLRSYYHLSIIESFMRMMGIEFERNFDLTADDVQRTINSNIRLGFFDNRIFLNLEDVRQRLNYIPLKKGAEITFTPSNPLLTVVDSGSAYSVYYGNRSLTLLHPQYFDYDSSIKQITLEIDGENRRVGMGEMVNVGEEFMVEPINECRVNVIGFTKPGIHDEAGLKIQRRDFARRFSLDNSGWIYRVEIYKNEKFSGMILVNFSKDTAKIDDPPEIPSMTTRKVRNISSGR